MALNPNEAPQGYVAVEKEGCGECAFSPYRSTICRRAIVPCSSGLRTDGKSVIFVRKPVETAIWPYDSEGTPVEVVA